MTKLFASRQKRNNPLGKKKQKKQKKFITFLLA